MSIKSKSNQFEKYLRKETEMKYLTILHYNNYEFELSYDIDGTWHKDIYISVDPLDYSIHGLPANLEDHEEAVRQIIEEDYGDIIEDLRAVDQAEYDDYVSSILG